MITSDFKGEPSVNISPGPAQSKEAAAIRAGHVHSERAGEGDQSCLTRSSPGQCTQLPSSGKSSPTWAQPVPFFSPSVQGLALFAHSWGHQRAAAHVPSPAGSSCPAQHPCLSPCNTLLLPGIAGQKAHLHLLSCPAWHPHRHHRSPKRWQVPWAQTACTDPELCKWGAAGHRVPRSQELLHWERRLCCLCSCSCPEIKWNNSSVLASKRHLLEVL